MSQKFVRIRKDGSREKIDRFAIRLGDILDLEGGRRRVTVRDMKCRELRTELISSGAKELRARADDMKWWSFFMDEVGLVASPVVGPYDAPFGIPSERPKEFIRPNLSQKVSVIFFESLL